MRDNWIGHDIFMGEMFVSDSVSMQGTSLLCDMWTTLSHLLYLCFIPFLKTLSTNPRNIVIVQ